MKDGLPDFVRARLDPGARYGLRLTLFGVALVLVAAPFFGLLVQVLSDGPLTRVDGDIADDLNRWVSGHPGLIGWIKAVSWLGRPPLLTVVVVIAVVFAWRRGRWRLALFLTVTSLGGGIVDTLVKMAVDRPRPEVEDPIASALGQSFPSGHAMSSTVVYSAVLLAYLPVLGPGHRKPAIGGVTLLVLAIGASRLLLGVHYLSDVLGGFVLGLAWLAGAVSVFEIWRIERSQPRSKPLKEGIEPEAGTALTGGDPPAAR